MYRTVLNLWTYSKIYSQGARRNLLESLSHKIVNSQEPAGAEKKKSAK
jgi:hypothetical protein